MEKGKLTLDNGVYEGEIANGKPNGKGKLTFTGRRDNGDIYEGDFVNGKLGKGKATWAVFVNDVLVYEGAFGLNAKPVGKGKITYPNGDVRESDLAVVGGGINTGKLTYKDGSVYEGEVNRGMPYNRGKVTFANGDVYEGSFEIFFDSKITDKGKMTCADGTVYEGYLKNGKPGKESSWDEPPPPFTEPPPFIDGDPEPW